MECKVTRNGQYIFKSAGAVKRKFSSCTGHRVQLDFATTVPYTPAGQNTNLRVEQSRHAPSRILSNQSTDDPFMNNMDEITYWIITRRAPCLMNYNNLVKSQSEHTSFSTPLSIDGTPSPKKKKKRKLSILDDDSISPEQQQNIYFEASQKNHKTVLSSCKSESIISDVDFNIKNSSIRDKPKRIKVQKNNRTTIHKKNKLATSTPKPTVLRRSLRRAQRSLNNTISQCATSTPLHTTGVNTSTPSHIKYNIKKSNGKSKQSLDKVINRVELIEHKDKRIINDKPEQIECSKLYEDMSDVSGFTANYIRSTKLHSSKSARNIRSKTTKNLIRESQETMNKDGRMLVYVNKSMNTTGLSKIAILNCSTDSSQNVVNLMTIQNNNNGRNCKVNRSTSLLKFMDTKPTEQKEKDAFGKIEENCQVTSSNNNINYSYLSKTASTSRYPKRHKVSNIIEGETTINSTINMSDLDNRKKSNRSTNIFNKSDRKENPDETTISRRTRSSRNIGLKVRRPENSVLVVSNITDPVSSSGTINVAISNNENKTTDITAKQSTNCLKYVNRTKTSVNKSAHSLKRDKSGFAACFSDSEDESEPLVQRKFFC